MSITDEPAILATVAPLMTKQDAAQLVLAQKARLGLTWAAIADALEQSVAWVTAALLGQHPMPEDVAMRAAELLELSEEAAVAFAQQPSRGALDTAVPTDPTMYRFYEVLQVYGPTIKALIHEEFGDGIMSAINFKLDIARRADPGGDRVVVTLDGKFLPYQWG
ncbi:cyanase [Amnibacterium endophyticum]|uniref:Cyanate hydratase n=1 Tax=Amnibacterium endophyticum TaxID=2109337 RepID=A0ABW4LGT9_9MICO